MDGATIGSYAEKAATVASAASPASGISAVANAVSGVVSAISGAFKSTPGIKLPLKNPLFAYASYDYNFTISSLTRDQYNYPDKSYMAGKKLPIICKSANADPNNRVKTAYGKSDFFIDNVVINTLIGNEKGNNSNAATMQFDIVEPYSMGMFIQTIQIAARDAGHPNWHDAPFLLTIQFRGSTEDGMMVNIPGTTRHIPFMFTRMSSKVTGEGARYQCKALPYNATAMSANHITLKSDVSIKGKTVQEILQTGEKSLQAAINSKTFQLKEDGIVKVPDEYVILFPVNLSSSDGNGANQGESKSTATVDTSSQYSSEDALFSSIGIARDEVSGLLVQSSDECNMLGKSTLRYSVSNRGSVPIGNDGDIYNDTGDTVVRGKNVIDFKESDFKFSQNSNIPNAINQVLLQSFFPLQTLDLNALSPEGYRDWWRIETQVFIKPTTANDDSTGEKPKLIVYRVVPYRAHAGAVSSVNTEPIGYALLRKQAVKEYNYIYTGKNVDILKFDIDYDASFMQYLNSDGFIRGQDAKTKLQQSNSKEQTVDPKVLAEGVPPSKKPGVNPDSVSNARIGSKTGDRGGAPEDTVTSVARMFHDAITEGVEMVRLNLEIIGDPYYIAQSGMGNYVSKQSLEYKNLNTDGTINSQYGEVDFIINFRSPTDINQSTGLYTIDRSDPNSSNAKSTPVLGYSGLYKIVKVTNNFKQGKFTQTIEALRRSKYGNPTKGTNQQVLNITKPAVEPDPPADQTPAAKEEDLTFAQAFARARKKAGNGQGQFTWHGKSYQTNYKGEPYVPPSKQKNVD